MIIIGILSYGISIWITPFKKKKRNKEILLKVMGQEVAELFLSD